MPPGSRSGGLFVRRKSAISTPNIEVMTQGFQDTFRTYADRSTRVFTVVRSQPSWVTRIAFGTALMVLVAIVFLLVVPAVVIGLIVFAMGMLITAIKRRFAGLRRPNGALDGRKNVKVITRVD